MEISSLDERARHVADIIKTINETYAEAKTLEDKLYFVAVLGKTIAGFGEDISVHALTLKANLRN